MSDVYELPISSSGYVLPGPPHIYAPNQIHVPASKPPTVYLPPTEATTETTTVEITEPSNVYLPPVVPEDPSTVYLPPIEIESSSTPPTITNEIVPPEIPEETCASSMCCEEASLGQFVIPIPLKSPSCCARVAKLILPINGFDADSIRKLTQSVSKELDATQLLINLINLVK